MSENGDSENKMEKKLIYFINVTQKKTLKILLIRLAWWPSS